MAKMAIGVIGAGVIGRTHCDRIVASDFASLAGIADPSPAGAELARQFGVPHYADHRHLLDSKKCTAVIVATPNDLHLPVALDAIAHGITVLVEKPVTTTVAEGEKLAKVAAAADVPVLVGHHRRYNPIVQRAREAITSGALGRITSATILYTFLKPHSYFDLAWRRRPGGGPVLINLIHEIDLVRHLLGDIASVQAIGSNAVRGFEVEDTAAVVLRLVAGCLVTISLSDTVAAPWSWDLAMQESALYPPQPVPVNTHFISGLAASLTLPTLEIWSYKGAAGWFAPITRETLAVDRGDPYTIQLRHLCAVARREAVPLITAKDGTETLRATLAVLEAARTGASVTLNNG